MKLNSHQKRGGVAARVLWSSAALLGGALILSGCPAGADLEDAELHLGATSGEACDAVPIFAEGCAGGICHGDDSGDAPAGGVDLVAPGVAARMLDIDAEYPDVTGCPEVPEKLIDSSNLDASLLWTKLNNTQVCGDGMPIPHSVSALDEAEMNCVRSWMEGVAANGATGGGTGGAAGTGGAGATGGTSAGGTGSGGMATGGTGTGGTMSMAAPVRVEAECALGAGTCGTVTGSASAEPMLESGDTTVGFFSTGATLTYSGVELDGHDALTIQHSKGNMGGSVEVRLDSATGTVIGMVTPPDNTDWDVFTPLAVPLNQSLTGAQTIVFVALDNDNGVMNLDWFEFSVGAAE